MWIVDFGHKFVWTAWIIWSTISDKKEFWSWYAKYSISTTNILVEMSKLWSISRYHAHLADTIAIIRNIYNWCQSAGNWPVFWRNMISRYSCLKSFKIVISNKYEDHSNSLDCSKINNWEAMSDVIMSQCLPSRNYGWQKLWNAIFYSTTLGAFYLTL